MPAATALRRIRTARAVASGQPLARRRGFSFLYNPRTVQLVDRIYSSCVRPDLPYFDLLDLVHQYLVPRTYVEIGVSTGRSFTLALPGTACIGVDPAPRLLFPVGRGNRIFAQTSDDFFDEHDLATLFGGVPLDLAFIDGMHHFEFALRDFINLEKASNPDTTILIHDCLPVDEVTAARDRTTYEWSGDVWRLILLLRQWRPELEISVVDWAPSGLGIVRGLDPRSTVLTEHYDEIVAHYLAMPYSALDDGTMHEQLNRVPGNWPTVKALLPERPFRPDNLELLKARRAASAVVPAARRAYAAHARRRAPSPPAGAPASTFDAS
jgi:hypothetical protein